jgi:uncharacterized lipoprotein YajG
VFESFFTVEERHISRRTITRRMTMKTIASALLALSVLAGIATQASAQSYGYSAPSVSQNQGAARGQ